MYLNLTVGAEKKVEDTQYDKGVATNTKNTEGLLVMQSFII